MPKVLVIVLIAAKETTPSAYLQIVKFDIIFSIEILYQCTGKHFKINLLTYLFKNRILSEGN